MRSEAAFGHPIVLGAVLASTIPFTMMARGFSTTTRVLLFSLTAGAIFVTGTRSAILAAVLGVIILVLGGHRHMKFGTRAVLVALAVVAAFPAASWLMATRADDDVEISSRGRERLYSNVLKDSHTLGIADFRARGQGGALLWRGRKSIDSTPIYISVTYGLFVAALFCLGLLIVLRESFSRRAGPAVIALAAQLPVLLTVAPITQLRTWWFALAGMAVTHYALTRREFGRAAAGGADDTNGGHSARTSSAPLRT